MSITVNHGWLMETLEDGTRVPFFINVREGNIFWNNTTAPGKGEEYIGDNTYIPDGDNVSLLKPEVDVAGRVTDNNGNSYDIYIEHDKYIRVNSVIKINSFDITALTEASGVFTITLPIGITQKSKDDHDTTTIDPQQKVIAKLQRSVVGTAWRPIPDVALYKTDFEKYPGKTFYSPKLSFSMFEPIYGFDVTDGKIVLDEELLITINYELLLK